MPVSGNVYILLVSALLIEIQPLVNALCHVSYTLQSPATLSVTELGTGSLLIGGSYDIACHLAKFKICRVN